MIKHGLLFIPAVLLITLFIIGFSNKDKTLKSSKRKFDFHYTFHFNKPEDSIIDPALFKPTGYKLSGRLGAELSPQDTLLRFVYYFQTEKNQTDSSLQLFKQLKSDIKGNSAVPSELFGCQLLGVYNSLQEDMPDNFYFYFYANNDELLEVLHMYRPSNVSHAVFFRKDSIDPTIKYKDDVAKLLFADQKFNPRDTVRVQLNIK